MKPCSRADADAAVKFAEQKFRVTFHEEQKTAIFAFLTGSDIFVGLPTGFGKSQIFQAIPVCYDFIVSKNNAATVPDYTTSSPLAIGVVVSPLVGLCKDQVQSLAKHGVKAIYLGDATDAEWKDVENGAFSLVYSSPEMLLDDRCSAILMGDLYTDRLCGLFIDEVHCVTKWGFSSGKTKAFRQHYSRLAELRSLVSSSVRMGVFTATATSAVRSTICENLALTNLEVISHVPNRPNIRYAVIKLTSSDVQTEFGWLVQTLRKEGRKSPRVIIYCQRRSDCSDLYGVFEDGMQDRESGIEPKNRLYAMYHAQTDQDIKQHIHQSFECEDGNVRVLFATVAFGMGIDAKGLNAVIHFGAPEDTDDYLQETGRGGRQGEESVAVLMHHPKAYNICRPSDAIKEYVAGTGCRRKALLENFATGEETEVTEHTFTCCDVCDADEASWIELAIRKSASSSLTTRVLSSTDKDSLQERLQQYRSTLIADLPTEGLLAGPDVATGFPEKLIAKIVGAAETVLTFEDFWTIHPFCSKEQAQVVFDIVESVVGSCCQVETLRLEDINFAEEFGDETDSDEDEYQEIILEDSEDDEI